MCNWWKWVIWIRLDYRNSRGSKEEGKGGGERRCRSERESDQKATRSEATTITSLTTGDTERVRVCLPSAWFRDIHENVICFDSQSHPSSVVRFTTPTPSTSPPSFRVIDFYWNKASASHKIAHPWWGARACIFSPPLPRLPQDFKGGGLRGGRVWRLSWSPDSVRWTFLLEIRKHGAWRTFLL